MHNNRVLFHAPLRGKGHIVVEFTDLCAGLVSNYQIKVLFEQEDCEDKRILTTGQNFAEETTVLQNRMHLRQQKFFDPLCTHICILRLPSVTSESQHNILSFEAVENPSVTSGGYPPYHNILNF